MRGLKANVLPGRNRVYDAFQKRLSRFGTRPSGVKPPRFTALFGTVENASKSFVFSTNFRDVFIHLGVPKAHGGTTEVVPCYKTSF
jgi:hypothetical protein